jgi:uncharacterized membrane protein
MNIENSWFILSLSAALFWALVNILDKILVIEHIKSQWARLILDSLVGLISCVLIYSLGLLSKATIDVMVLSILAGILLYGFNYLYYKALETADVSVTAVLMQTIPIFTAIWGYLFFDEIFSSIVYSGIALVVLGAVFSNIEIDSSGSYKIVGGKNWNATVLYIIPGIFLVSVNYALQKHILAFTNSWTVFFWGRIGAFLLTSFFLVTSRNARSDFFQTITKIKPRSLLMLSGVEWLNLSGIFLIISAYSLGPVTLVVTTSAIQPLFVIIIMIAVSIFRKKSILSDFSNNKRVLVTRIVASAILVIGIYFISK